MLCYFYKQKEIVRKILLKNLYAWYHEYYYTSLHFAPGTGSLILGDGAAAKELRSLGTFYLISCPKEQKYTRPTKQLKKCVRDILSFLP